MTRNEERRMVNEDQKQKIRKFTDLEVWQQSRMLAIEIYRVTRSFPKDEQFGMASQMKRAAVSVSSNIAEGFKRDTMKDKIRFYIQSHGSLTELQNQIIISNDVALIDKITENGLLELSEKVDRLLTGLIRASKERL